MIFNYEQIAALAQIEDLTLTAPFTAAAGGLWVGLLSSGSGVAEDQPLAAGALLLARDAVTLTPEAPCHLLAARLAGSAAAAFCAALPAGLLVAKGESCPRAAELLAELYRADAEHFAPRTASQLVYALLCELSAADSAATALPPLVAEAVNLIRSNYAGLYGVEELSEQLGVSKSHLVRSFTAAMGISPGKYLTSVRIDAAKRLLLHREYNLEIVASLCGFSGANYLCRVFRRETGQTPAAWRAAAMLGNVGLTAAEALQEQTMYM